MFKILQGYEKRLYNQFFDERLENGVNTFNYKLTLDEDKMYYLLFGDVIEHAPVYYNEYDECYELNIGEGYVYFKVFEDNVTVVVNSYDEDSALLTNLKVGYGDDPGFEYVPITRDKLKMWTTDNMLACDDLEVGTKVYFYSRSNQTPLVKTVYKKVFKDMDFWNDDTQINVVDIPDILLTKEENIKVQIDKNDYYQTFEVVRQNKPKDYDADVEKGYNDARGFDRKVKNTLVYTCAIGIQKTNTLVDLVPGKKYNVYLNNYSDASDNVVKRDMEAFEYEKDGKKYVGIGEVRLHGVDDYRHSGIGFFLYSGPDIEGGYNADIIVSDKYQDGCNIIVVCPDDSYYGEYDMLISGEGITCASLYVQAGSFESLSNKWDRFEIPRAALHTYELYYDNVYIRDAYECVHMHSRMPDRITLCFNTYSGTLELEIDQYDRIIGYRES